MLLLLLLAAAGLACVPSLRREHHRLVILRNLVEQAAAPDEPVLVDDWLIYRFLRWKGSPALQQQIVFTGRALPPTVLSASQEVITVAAKKDSLPATLRASGFALTDDATQATWIARGEGFSLPGRGVVHIYFAVRSGAPQVPSDAEAGRP